MAIVESKINGLWAAKQTAYGTPNAIATKRLRQVAGNLRSDRADGSEKFGTLNRWGDAQHFVDSIMGSGDPGIQAQPETLAYLLWLFAGQENVTGAGPYVHTITPAAAGGFWSTWTKRVGNGSDLVRERFNDCKISSLSIEGSTAQKVVRITPTIMSLDPGEKVAADPAAAFAATDAFVYTEGSGAFSINGAVVRGQSQFNITLNENLEPVLTDNPKPLGLVGGDPEANVGLTLALDTDGLAIYHREVYGTTTPATGAKPISTIPATGSYTFTLTKGAAAFTFTMNGIKWTPDVAVEANPSGGLTEVSLAGQIKLSGGNPEWQAVVTNADAAYTV